MFTARQVEESERELPGATLRQTSAEPRDDTGPGVDAGAVIGIDHAGRIVLMDARAERMFGDERDEVLGQPLEILLAGRSRHRRDGHRGGYFPDLLVQPVGMSVDLYGRRRNGREFAVEGTLGPVATKNGVVLTSIIRDRVGA